MTKEFNVGVSGFSYPGWKGKFYPKDLKGEEFLAYYSQHLRSVEINSSFYAPPRASMVKSWSERTSESFKFSFKAPKQITHVLKLGKGSVEAADRFSKVLDGLGQRRGPILFQLPPFSKVDHELLGEFLSGTTGIKDRVFEFRHESWLEDSTYRLLERNGAGFCIAETEELGPTFKVTGGIAYFRLRKEFYNPKVIDQWAEKISETAKGSKESYVYLRHDETGENAILAQRLSEKLKSADD
ncbi:MAG: DUF72 domain-containing protein [Thaumarchaeota archaeon]|nr:DUF72 domain-containing protein [Nitrososphaerota archaeon]